MDGNGMTFSTSDIYYTFTGEILSYSASFPNLTFDNGSAQNRIDAVVMNEGGTLSIVKGTPAATPAKPPISDSQILVQYAYIFANSTSIGTSDLIYSNNGQWTVTNYQLSGLQSGTYDPSFSGDDFVSGSCVQMDTDYRTGVKFTYPLGLGPTASSTGSLSMRIKFTSIVPEQKSLFAQIQGTANGDTVYGNTVNLMTYGLQRDVVNRWQHVVVPTSKFGSDIANYQALTLRMAGGASGSNTLWRADNILLQRGRSFDGYMGEPDATGGSVGSSAVTGGVIGPAEDGTYTDGVFTDFIPSTPIGTAVDRFNELFLALVPAPALILSDWSGSRTGGVNGKLSFGTTDQTLDGTTYFAASSANGASPAVAADGQWSASGKRLSIYPANAGDISGTLASNAAADPSLPTPAYVANSFREALLGNLTLSINGIIVSTASLSSINNTSGNSVSGVILSAATSSKFPGGKSFETDNPLFTSRTGTWLVKANDPRIRNGYNYIIAEHKSTAVNTFTRTLARFDFIQDANTFGTTFSGFSITSFALSGNKPLSGISFFTGGTINYDGTMSNLYRNTYNPDSDAVSFNDASISGNAGTTPIVNVSGTSKFILAGGDDETRNVRLSTDYNSSTPLAFPLITSGKRRLNDTIGISTTAKRTLQGTRTGGTSSISNVYLDNVGDDSTDRIERFNSETYRLKGETAGLSYSVVANITGNAWVSTNSLVGADANHNTGLQVYNGRLYYPTIDFSAAGSLATNLNFGDSTKNYSTATGTRTYIRYFYQASPTTGNYKITFTGTNTTFVAATTALTGNNAHVHLKLPTGSATGTGWLDCFTTFVQATADNSNYQSGGAYAANVGTGTDATQKALNGVWGLSTGTRKTNVSNGYVVVRLTVAATWAGYIEDITFTFA